MNDTTLRPLSERLYEGSLVTAWSLLRDGWPVTQVVYLLMGYSWACSDPSYSCEDPELLERMEETRWLIQILEVRRAA
jgi:hypothetical protein